MDSDQTNFKSLWPWEQKLLGALRMAMRMWWLCLLAIFDAAVWGEGHWAPWGCWIFCLCTEQGEPCQGSAEEIPAAVDLRTSLPLKLAGSCVFQGLSCAWRSLEGEQRPASHHTRHSLGPRAVRTAPWGLGMPGVCPSWQPEAVQVGVLLSPQWGAEGTVLRLHITQDC